MEVDESITNDESQQRNVYGSLIDPEERENSEASEVGDKSTCKTSIHCRIYCRNICLCCYLWNEINIIFSSSLYRVSFRTYLLQKCAVHVMVRVHGDLAEVRVRARRLTKTALRIAFAIKRNAKTR